MKKTPILLCLLTLGFLTLHAEAPQKVLYVYDEINKESEPYIAHFRSGFAQHGIAFDETDAGSVENINLAKYDTIVIHSMVMAFAQKSPVRDWIKKDTRLKGKNVALFVTANRWFLETLFSDIDKHLHRKNAIVVDALSMATKKTTDTDEKKAVHNFISNLKN